MQTPPHKRTWSRGFGLDGCFFCWGQRETIKGQEILAWEAGGRPPLADQLQEICLPPHSHRKERQRLLTKALNLLKHLPTPNLLLSHFKANKEQKQHIEPLTVAMRGTKHLGLSSMLESARLCHECPPGIPANLLCASGLEVLGVSRTSCKPLLGCGLAKVGLTI